MDSTLETDSRRYSMLMAGQTLLLASLLLPLVGWIAEATHLVSPLSDGSLLLGVVAGSAFCAALGLMLVSKGPVQLKTVIPGLVCLLASGIALFLGRFAEIRHWVSPASTSDFWLSLATITWGLVAAVLGLVLTLKAPPGLWNRTFVVLAVLVVALVSGFCFLGLIGLLL